MFTPLLIVKSNNCINLTTTMNKYQLQRREKGGVKSAEAEARACGEERRGSTVSRQTANRARLGVWERERDRERDRVLVRTLVIEK